MACSVTITSVTGIPATPGGSTTSSIHITGTLSGDCEPIIFSPTDKHDVVVQVDCGGGPVQAPALSSGGSWAVDVPAACSCSKLITVRASCATNPECTTTFTGILNCQESGCPAGSITFVVEDCNADGTRNVALTANILASPPGAVGQWVYGDGQLGAGVSIPGPGVYPDPNAPHPYVTPGPYTAQFVWILPASCPPLSATLPALAACPIDCPAIVSISATPGACSADGTHRQYSFDVTLSGGTPQQYHWDFGDGVQQSIAPPALPATSHEFLALGTGVTPYTVTFAVTGFAPGCIDTKTLVVNVAGCGGCPTIGPVTAEFGDCTDDHTRTVTLHAVASAAGATEYDWDFGDGSPPEMIDAVVHPDPSTDHSYAAPGNYTATVTMKGPPGCPDTSASLSFAVASCNGNGNGGNGGNGWCGAIAPIIGALAVIATALTVFVLALQICPALASIPVPSWLWYVIAGLWIAVGIALAVWKILCSFNICPCSSCDLVAIGWMAALSGVVIALYLMGCCAGSFWWLMTLVLAAAFLAAFGYWLAQCHPDKCQIVDLLLIVFASVIAVVFAYINLIPMVAACANHVVSTGAATIAAILAVLAAICHASSAARAHP